MAKKDLPEKKSVNLTGGTPVAASSNASSQPPGSPSQSPSSASLDATVVTPPGGMASQGQGGEKTILDNSSSRRDVTQSSADLFAKTLADDQASAKTVADLARSGSGMLREADASAATIQDSRIPVSEADMVATVQDLWAKTITGDATVEKTLKSKEISTATISPTATGVIVQTKAIRPMNDRRQMVSDYEIIKVLGEGGMGVVYTARQTAIDREIALKMVKGKAATDPALKSKFILEAAVTGDLEHPNIIPIYDLGCDAEGKLFYAMRKIRGKPWDKCIKDLSLQENLDIFLKVTSAIAYAHSKGVIHRDLKPENTMIGDFGEVVVMDWGLATSVVEGGKAEHISKIAPIGGTPAYMAPEMASGNASMINTWSDIYLLGGILYEIVTGLKPHTGKDVMDCLKNAYLNKIQPTDKKGELVEIALKAMATDPKKRYASVLELQEAIKNYQAHANSITLSDKAAEHLAQAKATKDYQSFSRAQFGFQEALTLWPENRAAAEGVVTSRVAYATCAYEKGDYDLAASLVDPSRPEEAKLAKDIDLARKRREAHQRRLKTLTRLAVGLVSAVVVIVCVAYVLVSKERDIAIEAKKRAEEARNQAIAAQKAEAEQRKAAEEARNQAIAAQKAEAEQRKAAEEARNQAIAAQKAEAEQRKAAEEALRRFLEEQEAKKKAQDALAKAGMLLEDAKWKITPEEAKQRQAEAAQATQLPLTQTIDLGKGVTLELVLIPAGEFVMGSPPGEPNRTGDEFLHRVEISNPFYMSRYEVTRAVWEAVTGEPAPAKKEELTPQHPVTTISWTEIIEKFLPRLQEKALPGMAFRLPTEAEWEYACRAGSRTMFYSGMSDEDLGRVAVFRLNSERKVHPVGTREPNAWGLYDMHGNVAEWCLDVYVSGFYTKEEALKSDPISLGAGDFRVVRGGGWSFLPKHCRAAYRSFGHVDNKYDFLGFRLVLGKPMEIPRPSVPNPEETPKQE